MAKNKEKPGFWSPENLRSLFFLIILVLCFRWSIASPYHVPTASMEPSIKVGDRLLAFKLSYGIKIPFTDFTIIEWDQPTHGDIIVFRFPNDPSLDYVKRVVGLPGDKISVKDNVLFINGKAQIKQEHNNDRSILTDITDAPDKKDLYRETLQEKPHWVLHNRNQSFKSQYPNNGGEFEVQKTATLS